MKTLTKLTDKKLISLKGENDLKNAVIDIMIDRSQSERINFITDALKHGCISGMVGELTYYADTTEFYNKYKEQIYDLATEQAEEIGYKNAVELYSYLNCIK